MARLRMPEKGGTGEVPLDLPPALVPVLSVGLSDVPGAVASLQDDVIAYVSGRCVATFSSDASKIRVSEALKDVKSITAMTMSGSHKWLAVAEFMAGMRQPQVCIMSVDKDLERVAVLKGPGVGKYTNISFSADDSLVVACGCDEEQTSSVFHVWEWRESTAPASSGHVSGLVTAVSINPKFPTNVVTQSAEQLAYWRLGSNGYKEHPMQGLAQKVGTANYIDHCWLADGRLALGLSNKTIVFMEGVDVAGSMSVTRGITCMAAMPDGCLLVAMQQGHLELFKPGKEKDKDKGEMVKQAHLKLPSDTVVIHGDNSILHMSVDPSGDKVACYVRHGPLFTVNTAFAKTSSFARNESMDMWEMALPSTHAGAIVSASVALRKDFIVTASEDLSVRVWQFNPLRLVASHLCHHSPLAVGIDPGAAELVVAYVDCVRCYTVAEGALMEVGALTLPEADGKPPVEMQKCSRVKYNPTGHLIAVVGGVGGKDIFIFSALKRTLLAQLKGHYAAVQDIAWSDDGLYLCSVSEGAVYTWHMEKFSRCQENTVKTFINNSIACTPDFHTLVVGDGSGLRLLNTLRARDAPNGPASKADQAAGGRAPTSPSRAAASPTRAASAAAAAAAAARGSDAGSGSTGAGGEGKVTFASAAADSPAQVAMKAVSRMGALGLGERKTLASDMASKFGRDVAGLTSDVPELQSKSTFSSLMQPLPAGVCVATCPDFSAIVGAMMMGRMRVSSLPPTSSTQYQEYAPHTSDITVMAGHHSGRLVFSADASGCWMMHVLVAPRLFEGTVRALLSHHTPRTPRHHYSRSASPAPDAPGAAAAAAATADAEAALGRPPSAPYFELASLARRTVAQFLRPADTSADIVVVRGVDVQLLKENVREMKDRLAKSATQADYKVYEKEQEMRRLLDTEVGKAKREFDTAHDELQQVKEDLAETKAALLEQRRQMQTEHAEALRAERDRFESKLAVEIERTNEAEKEVQRLKAKFGKKLWDVEEDRRHEAIAAHEQVEGLENRMVALQHGAEQSIHKAHEQMDTELRVDMELNEEEIDRLQGHSKAMGEEKEERYMRLLAKHTLQSGLSNKTNQINDELKKTNETLVKENVRLADQIRGLTEELQAMHAAWTERDLKQRMQDVQMKELSHQVAQGRLYTSLATSRVQELNGELEPLRTQKQEAMQQVARMEALQVRQAEKRMKFQQGYESLQSRLDHALEELRRTKQAAEQKEAYFTNFTTQLFRTTHTVPPDKWATIFGKLYADYMEGKDKAEWSRYLPSTGASSARDSGDGEGEDLLPGSLSGKTEQEYKRQLAELSAQVFHTEKLMIQMRETREKESAGQRGVIQRLVSDNMTVLSELNVHKKDLKTARETIDRLQVELSQARQVLQQYGIGRQPTPQQLAASARLIHSSSSDAAAAAGMGSGAGAGGPPGSAGFEPIPEAWAVSVANGAGPAAGSAAAAPDGSAAAAPPAGFRPSTAPKPPSRLGPRGGGSEQQPPVSPPAHANYPNYLQPPEDRPSTSQSLASGAAVSAVLASEPIHVSGEMPSGGWWLGPNNLFEVPSNLNIIKGDLPPDRMTTPSSPSGSRRRPATSDAATSVATSVPLSGQSARYGFSPPGSAGAAGGGINTGSGALIPMGSYGAALSPTKRPSTSDLSGRPPPGGAASSAVPGAPGLHGHHSHPHHGPHHHRGGGSGNPLRRSGGSGGPPIPPRPQGFTPQTPANPLSSGGLHARATLLTPPSTAGTDDAGGAGVRDVDGAAAAAGPGSGTGGPGVLSSEQWARGPQSGASDGYDGYVDSASGHQGRGEQGVEGGAGELPPPALQRATSLPPPGAITLPPNFVNFIQGSARPTQSSRLTTMGAGFRSFVPRGAGGASGAQGSASPQQQQQAGPRRSGGQDRR